MKGVEDAGVPLNFVVFCPSHDIAGYLTITPTRGLRQAVCAEFEALFGAVVQGQMTFNAGPSYVSRDVPLHLNDLS